MAVDEIRSTLERRAVERVRRLRRALDDARAVAGEAERISAEAADLLRSCRPAGPGDPDPLVALGSAADHLRRAAAEARRAVELVRARREELEARLAGERSPAPAAREAYDLIADAVLRAGRATSDAECAAVIDELERALAAADRGARAAPVPLTRRACTR
jgi:hypothetical protein